MPLLFKLTLAYTITLLSFQNVRAQNTAPYWSLAGNSNASTSSKLGTTNATNLRILTNNLERMHISSTGLVGIGTTSPSQILHVVGNGVFTGNAIIGSNDRANQRTFAHFT